MSASHIQPQKMPSSEWIPNADWRTIDEAINTLARRKGELDLEIGRWLLAALRARVDRRCGFGSFAEYVERRLGYDARTLKEKLRVASALESLPRLRALLGAGERSWSAVREVARVATAETEAAWITSTERRTVREIERMVSGRKPGDLPSDVKDPLLVSRRMVFELAAEDFAIVSEALERMRVRIGARASNVEALVAMAESELEGRPAEQPSYRTSLTICATCDRTWTRAGGEMVEVSPANAECARCDGQLIGFTRIEEGVAGEAEKGGHFEPAAVPSNATETSSKPALEGTLAPLDPRLGARGMLRLASRVFGVPLRSVTPRLKKAVRARDGGCCVVPGCTNFRFIELHHRDPRAKGGPNKLGNLACLCSSHHRAVHEGLLSIEGNAVDGYVVRHADGTLYGAALAASPIDPRGSAAA